MRCRAMLTALLALIVGATGFGPPATVPATAEFAAEAVDTVTASAEPTGTPPAAAIQEPASGETILLLFDSSHSMRHFLYTDRKIDIAKEGVRQVLSDLPDSTRVGLRAFAHFRTHDDCGVTELLAPFTAGATESLLEVVEGFDPVGTETPLALALEAAHRDLLNVEGPKRIVLLSDGEETCAGDPVEVAAELGRQGIPVDVVGIGAERSIGQFEQMAAANGSSYVQARNGAALQDALADLFRPRTPEFSTTGAGTPDMDMVGTPASGAPAPDEAPPASREAPERQGIPPPGDSGDGIDVHGVDLEVILDVSNSMWGQIEGVAKIDLARRALRRAFEALDFDAVEVAFRAYGHRIDRSEAERGCLDTELVEDFDVGNRAPILEHVESLSPKGQTPIALSLEKAGEDILPRTGYRHFILLVSDGKESCDGDPEAVARRLREQGIDVVIHTVGFDVDPAAAAQLQAVSEATGGHYFPAEGYEALADSLEAVTEVVGEHVAIVERQKYRNPVWGGPSPADAVPLKPGRYTLKRHLEEDEYTYFRLEVGSGQRLAYATEVTSYLVTAGDALIRSHVYAALYGAGGEQIRHTRAGAIGALGSRDTREFLVTPGGRVEPGTVVLGVGSQYGPIHRDSLFEVWIEDRFDADTGRDLAPDDDHPIRPGTRVRGSLGAADETDRFRVVGPFPAGSRVVVDTSPANPGFRLQVEILGVDGRRIERTYTRGGDNRAEAEIPRDLDHVYVVITDRNLGDGAGLTWYTMEVRAPDR